MYLGLAMLATACAPSDNGIAPPPQEATIEATAQATSPIPAQEVLTQEMTTLEEALNSEMAVVDFSADWCPPCQTLEGPYAEVAALNPDIGFYRVDIDVSPEMLDRYGFTSIPTIIYFKDGEEVGRDKGIPTADTSELVEHLQERVLGLYL